MRGGRGPSLGELRPDATRRGGPGGGTHGRTVADLAGLGPTAADLLGLRLLPSSHLELMRRQADMLLPQVDAAAVVTAGRIELEGRRMELRP